MGQYWKICNLDKKEYLHPHRFGDGLKFCEFGYSGSGTMTGLAILLAAPESMGTGGGDLHNRSPEYLGRWIGDRVVILGDYYDEPQYAGVYHSDDYTDISEEVRKIVDGG
jgi:hypothetical protein